MLKLSGRIVIGALALGCLFGGSIISNVSVANAAAIRGNLHSKMNFMSGMGGQWQSNMWLQFGRSNHNQQQQYQQQFDQQPYQQQYDQQQYDQQQFDQQQYDQTDPSNGINPNESGFGISNRPGSNNNIGMDIISSVADILGVEKQTVLNDLKNGKTLAEIAESYNVSEDTLLEKLETLQSDAIDEAVTAGTLTDTQAATLKTKLTENLTEIVEGTTGKSKKTPNNTLSSQFNLTAKAESSSEIYLTWDSVSDATSYYVYRATSPSGTYINIATVTTTSYTNTGLSAGTTYFYKVQAVNSDGSSAYSSKAYATTNSESTLSAPMNLTAIAESSSEIYLAWDSVSDATSYCIYRATSASGNYIKIATVTTTSYTNTGLSADRTYYYKVRAVDSDGSSAYSSKAYASTSTD